MENVLFAAIGVGGATLIGSLLGFIFRAQAEKHVCTILSVAAGIMLAAAVTNLIAPALLGADIAGVLLVIFGLFAGAGSIYATERLIPSGSFESSGARSAILFAVAMGLHNLPEGIAAGLGFGTGNASDAVMVTVGIALHNIPEGMITIFPMLSAGVRRRRAFLFAAAGGIAEVLGTFIGYIAAEAARPVLPFALAFAGGTMLYVVASEMIPEGQASGRRRAAFSLILGYSLMTALGVLLSG